MNKVKHTESAGGVVVNTKTGDVLVVNQNSDSWSLPKGHIDKGEDSLTAAKREILEESGVLSLEFVQELGEYKRFRMGLYSKDDKSVIKNIQMYLFTTEQQELNPTDPENPEARWVERGEVSKLLSHPKDKKFFKSVKHLLPSTPTN